jgi:hypothetical protein
MTATYLNLHAQGKRLMHKAHDKHVHGHTHAKKVQQNCAEILAELQVSEPDKYSIKDIDLMVETAAWWHDSYKRLQKTGSLYALFHEGEEASKIFLANKDAKDLPEAERDMIAQAIKVHNSPYLFTFAWRKMPPVTRILLESDGVETVKRDRILHSINRSRTLFLKVFHIFLYCGFCTFFFLMPLTKTARRIYWDNLLGKN